jgi:hypothetical protein
MIVHPPIGKHKKYPPLLLTVIHAWERGKPEDRKPICWKLLTDLPVEDLDSAIEKVVWYSQRWKIETFHKVLKSGCRVEDATRSAPTNVVVFQWPYGLCPPRVAHARPALGDGSSGCWHLFHR